MNSNKNIFYEQQMLAMQIIDVYNPEMRKKLMKIGKRQDLGKGYLPGPEIIYSKEIVIKSDPSYNKIKKRFFSGYENPGYSYIKQNEIYGYENSSSCIDQSVEDYQYTDGYNSFSKKSKKSKKSKFQAPSLQNSSKTNVSCFSPKDSNVEKRASAVIYNKRRSFETTGTDTTNNTNTKYKKSNDFKESEVNFSHLYSDVSKKLEKYDLDNDIYRDIQNRGEEGKNLNINQTSKDQSCKQNEDDSTRSVNQKFSEKELKTQFYCENSKPRFSLKTDNLNISSKTSKNDVTIISNFGTDTKVKENEEMILLTKSISYPEYFCQSSNFPFENNLCDKSSNTQSSDNHIKSLFRKREKSRFSFADTNKTPHSLKNNASEKSETSLSIVNQFTEDLPDVIDKILYKKTSRFLFFKKFCSIGDIKSDLPYFDNELNCLDNSWMQFIKRTDCKKEII